MSLTIPSTTQVILFGAGDFPKDDSLASIPAAQSNINKLKHLLQQGNIIGIDGANITSLVNIEDNVQIMEDASAVCEQAKEALLVYITGHIITRKGHLYLATPHSSRKKIHINGIALDELMDIISETEAETKIFIFDALYSDTNDEATDGSVIEDALKYYESAYSGSYILSSSPNVSSKNFFSEHEGTVFTNALTDILQNGMNKEQEMFTLSDLHKALKVNISGPSPLKSSSPKASDLNFAFNTKFVAFSELKREADAYFEEQNFHDALKAYKKAGKLFEKNSEVAQKKEFIKLLIEGEDAIASRSHEDAKAAFLLARELFDFPIVRNKINDVTLTIANQLFDKEQYESARGYYKAVGLEMPENAFVKERLDKCDHELRFLDLIDEADKLYFEDDFEQALKLYGEALEIHPDRKATKRKAECERLIHKASMIQERLEHQHEQKSRSFAVSEATLKQEREKLETELRGTIEAELRDKVESEIVQKLEQDWAEKLWSNVSLANNLEVYDFYIQYYPSGKHLEKAQKRFEELKDRQEEQAKKVADSIKKSAEQLADMPSVTSPKEEEIEKEEAKIEVPKTETPKIKSEETEKKPADNPEKTEKRERPETPDDILRMLDERPKKHKPFIMEEKGEKNVSIDNSLGFLDEIEATFGKGEAPSKEKKEVESKIEPAPLSEEEVKAQMNDSIVKDEPKENVSEEVKDEVIPDLVIPEEPEAESKEESTPLEEEVVDNVMTPIGVDASEASELSEEQLWQKASEANSIDAFRFYVDNTKESEHLVDAYYQINKLNKLADAGLAKTEEPTYQPTGYSYNKEEKVEEKPVVNIEKEKIEEDKEETTTSTESYEMPYSYNGDSSTSNGNGSVNNDDEEDDALWEKAKSSDTVNAYYEYVANSKAKNHLDNAKSRINELKQSAMNSEEEDWASAEGENSIDGYKHYIKKYPLGHYYAKAMFRISELEAQL